MSLRRVALAVALAASACSKSHGSGGWQEPVDPPMLGAATLSTFESDNGHCRWIQVDPVGGSRRALAWLDDDCGDPSVTWSPDGRRAVIFNADNPEDHLVEISMINDASRKIAPPPGSLSMLFYREGSLYAWTTVDVPPSLLERLGLRKATGGESLEQSFRLVDSAWVPSQATPPDGELRAEYESSSMATGYPDLRKAPESATAKLSDEYGYDDWRELGRPDALMAWSDGMPVGILLFRQAGGKWVAAEDSSTDGYSDSSTSLQLRGRYALLVGDMTRVYDLEAQKLVYSSTSAIQAVFWPPLGSAREP